MIHLGKILSIDKKERRAKVLLLARNQILENCRFLKFRRILDNIPVPDDYCLLIYFRGAPLIFDWFRIEDIKEIDFEETEIGGKQNKMVLFGDGTISLLGASGGEATFVEEEGKTKFILSFEEFEIPGILRIKIPIPEAHQPRIGPLPVQETEITFSLEKEGKKEIEIKYGDFKIILDKEKQQIKISGGKEVLFFAEKEEDAVPLTKFEAFKELESKFLSHYHQTAMGPTMTPDVPTPEISKTLEDTKKNIVEIAKTALDFVGGLPASPLSGVIEPLEKIVGGAMGIGKAEEEKAKTVYLKAK